MSGILPEGSSDFFVFCKPLLRGCHFGPVRPGLVPVGPVPIGLVGPVPVGPVGPVPVGPVGLVPVGLVGPVPVGPVPPMPLHTQQK